MKRYKPNEDGWYCGWWNDSPLQINCAKRNEIYKNEALHFHKDFCEYYIVLDGYLVLSIDKKEHKLLPGEIIMVEPLEKHCVIEVPEDGCRYMTIKSKSYKNNKILV